MPESAPPEHVRAVRLEVRGDEVGLSLYGGARRWLSIVEANAVTRALIDARHAAIATHAVPCSVCGVNPSGISMDDRDDYRLHPCGHRLSLTKARPCFLGDTGFCLLPQELKIT